MFGLSWTEVVVIAVVAIIFIGPKDLPVVLRTAGRLMRKARVLMAEFRSSVDEVLRESELDDIRRETEAAKRLTEPFAEPKPAAPPEAAKSPAPGDAPPKA